MLSNTQMKHIIDRASSTYPDIAEMNRQATANREQSTYNLAKFKLNVRMLDSATMTDRLMLSNIILSTVDNDPSMIFFDDVKVFNEFRQKFLVVDMLNTISSIICFSLGAFMLMTTIGANIKDSMWDLGVLRSMGSTKEQITRILCFEMISNTLSAMTLGYGSGILVSVLSIAQFYILVELPLSITFPKRNMLILGVGAIFSMIIGAKYGTSAFQRKNISSILKGT